MIHLLLKRKANNEVMIYEDKELHTMQKVNLICLPLNCCFEIISLSYCINIYVTFVLY